MSRLLPLLFWLLMALNVSVLGLWFVLGLAAARPSHTPMPTVVAFFAVPALVLAAVALLFLRGPWPSSRGVAFGLAAVPALVIGAGVLMSVGWRGLAGLQGESAEGWGRTDAALQQQMEAAIAARDVPAVARIAATPKARLDEAASLVAAVRGIESPPHDTAVLRALLAAGLNPNHAAGSRAPLAEAIRVSRVAGAEPVRLLLDAGAHPNLRPGAQPVWFEALSPRVDAGVLPLLLARGADLRAVDMAGSPALYWAAHHRNWTAALRLVEQGALWQAVRLPQGEGLLQRVEAARRQDPADPSLARLAQALRAAPSAAVPAATASQAGR